MSLRCARRRRVECAAAEVEHQAESLLDTAECAAPTAAKTKRTDLNPARAAARASERRHGLRRSSTDVLNGPAEGDVIDLFAGDAYARSRTCAEHHAMSCSRPSPRRTHSFGRRLIAENDFSAWKAGRVMRRRCRECSTGHRWYLFDDSSFTPSETYSRLIGPRARLSARYASIAGRPTVDEPSRRT